MIFKRLPKKKHTIASMIFNIVFQNNDFVVAVKPEGVSFHSEAQAGFVVLLEHQLNTKLFSVHRLDKMTSGLILLAKSSAVANTLTGLFEHHLIEKYYLAISTRKPKKKQGWVKGDMASSRRGSYKLLTTKENQAITQFKSYALREHERLFLVKPHTGKTHQIRVALKSLGAPVAGDIRYANAVEAKQEDRGYLHAYALRFEHKDTLYSFVQLPSSGERYLSDVFVQQMQDFTQPWELF